MKRSQDIRTARIAVLAALAIPVAALAQEPPEQPPVDPATPVDTAPPADPVPPDDPMQTVPPWTPPTTEPPTQSAPPTTPRPRTELQADTTRHVLQGREGQEVRLNEHPPDSVVGDYSVDFDAMDTDGDGHISRGEASANQTLSAEFDGVDRDRDGRLSREELADWIR